MGVESPNITDTVALEEAAPLSEDRLYESGSIIFEGRSSQGWYLGDGSPYLGDIELRWVAITQAELDTLETFLDARKGRAEIFYWDHPTRGTLDIKCRAVDGKLRVEHMGGGYKNARLRIEQVA
ncbi:MAG: hypothetical protein GY716_10320 [bacterium]|nr:hypothetical protein [bacterium]